MNGMQCYRFLRLGPEWDAVQKGKMTQTMFRDWDPSGMRCVTNTVWCNVRFFFEFDSKPPSEQYRPTPPSFDSKPPIRRVHFEDWVHASLTCETVSET